MYIIYVKYRYRGLKTVSTRTGGFQLHNKPKLIQLLSTDKTGRTSTGIKPTDEKITLLKTGSTGTGRFQLLNQTV